MMRSLFFLPAVLSLAAPALADPGLHHHPHGAEGVWLLLAVAGAIAGVALAQLWGRK